MEKVADSVGDAVAVGVVVPDTVGDVDQDGDGEGEYEPVGEPENVGEPLGELVLEGDVVRVAEADRVGLEVLELVTVGLAVGDRDVEAVARYTEVGTGAVMLPSEARDRRRPTPIPSPNDRTQHTADDGLCSKNQCGHDSTPNPLPSATLMAAKGPFSHTLLTRCGRRG